MLAWFKVHRGVQVAVIGALSAGFFAAYASMPIPSWKGGPPIPLWALAPGTLALLVSVAAEDSLNLFIRQASLKLTGPRMLWMVAVAAVVGVLATPTALVIGQPKMITVAVLLSMLTFGASVMVGRGGWLVGATVDVLALILWQRFYQVSDPLGLIGRQIGTVGWAMVVVALVASLWAYSARGPRVSEHVASDGPE